MSFLTEDGFKLKYGETFWIVCIENIPMDIGTDQELKLYVPIPARYSSRRWY